KFDPITQQDYYALAGVFASTRQADRPVRIAKNQATIPLAPAVEDAGLYVLPDGPYRTKLEYRPGVARDVAVQVRGSPAHLRPVDQVAAPRNHAVGRLPTGEQSRRSGWKT